MSAQLDVAERLSIAILEPVREVGALLATEIDKLRAEVDSLKRRVADLEARANGFTGP